MTNNINYSYILKNSTAILLTLILISNVVWIFQSNGYYDFGSFYESGKAANTGLNPYDMSYQNIYTVEFTELNLIVHSINLNPPIALPIFQLFALTNPHNGLIIIRILSIILFLISIFLLTVEQSLLNKLSLISFAGLWHVIQLGQIYALLLFLLVLALRYHKTHNNLSSCLFGLLIAIKPHLLVIPLMMILSANWKTGIKTIFSFITFTLISLMLYGFPVFEQWFISVSSFNGLRLPANFSVIGLFARFDQISFAYILCGIILMICSYIVFRSKEASFFLIIIYSIVLSLLLSPVSWSGYSALLFPYFATSKLSLLMKGLISIFIFPYWLIRYFYIQNTAFYYTFGWLYGYAYLVLLFGLTLSILRSGARYELINA